MKKSVEIAGVCFMAAAIWIALVVLGLQVAIAYWPHGQQ